MKYFFIGLFLILGYVALFSGGVLLSKDRIAEELIAAVEAKDMETIEKRVDFGAIRSYLKADLGKKSRAVRSGQVNMGIGPVPDKVDEIVEYYVQPEMVAYLLDKRLEIFPDFAAKDFVYTVGFQSPLSFHITVGYPKNEGSITTLTDKMTAIRFIFKAQGGLFGLRWQAKEMDVPLFMVPPEVYDRSELDRILSQADNLGSMTP